MMTTTHVHHMIQALKERATIDRSGVWSKHACQVQSFRFLMNIGIRKQCSSSSIFCNPGRSPFLRVCVPACITAHTHETHCASVEIISSLVLRCVMPPAGLTHARSAGHSCANAAPRGLVHHCSSGHNFQHCRLVSLLCSKVPRAPGGSKLPQQQRTVC